MSRFIVDTVEDVIDAQDGVLSLREAVIAANERDGVDTIIFTGALEDGTIQL